MRMLAGLILIFGLSAATQAQQLTVHDALQLQKNLTTGEFASRGQWNALSYYLQGLIEGSAAYQQVLKDRQQTPLFCAPKGKHYSVQELMQILHASDKSKRSKPVSLVIMETYAQRYPCDG